MRVLKVSYNFYARNSGNLFVHVSLYVQWNPALTDFKRLTNFIYYRHNSVVANIRIKRKLVERTRIDISLRRNSLKSGSVRAGYKGASDLSESLPRRRKDRQ